MLDSYFKVAVCRIVAKTIAAVKFKTLQCVTVSAYKD